MTICAIITKSKSRLQFNLQADLVSFKHYKLILQAGLVNLGTRLMSYNYPLKHDNLCHNN